MFSNTKIWEKWKWKEGKQVKRAGKRRHNEGEIGEIGKRETQKVHFFPTIFSDFQIIFSTSDNID